MVPGRQGHDGVSFDINPSWREVPENLIEAGHLQGLVHAGARVHQGRMQRLHRTGQAPAAGRSSLRRVPRNFPGRSGTREDSVFLCSPETARASALTGVVTDPRECDSPYPKVALLDSWIANNEMLVPPLSKEDACAVRLEKT